MKSILLYDTTLRDGAQGENISFTAEDKLRIAQRLDYLARQGLVMREKISLPKGYRYAYFSPDKKELARLAKIKRNEKMAEIERALGN